MADLDPLLAVAPLAGQTLNTLAHLTLSRLTGRHAPSIAAAALLGVALALGLAATSLVRAGAPPLELAVVLAFVAATSGALAFGYWGFVNLNVTSIRIRLVKELDARGQVGRAELQARYDPRQLAQVRVERLLRYGQLVLEDGQLRLRGRALLAVALGVEALKHVVLGRGSRLR